MRFVFSILVLLSLNIGLSYAQIILTGPEAQEWSSYYSDDLKYSFIIPGTPGEQIQEVSSEIGIVWFRTFGTDCSNDPNCKNLVYITSGAKLPDYFSMNADSTRRADFLNGWIADAVRNANGKIISDRVVVNKQYSGREIEVSLNDGKEIMTARFFITEKYYYAHIVFTEKGKMDNTYIRKFLDSFDYQN